MTLNITITSEDCIYQSADFRLVDTGSGKHADFGVNQKIFLINRRGWHATLCYCGVGRFGAIHTTEWLSERIAQVDQDDPIEKLTSELRLAESWLALVPPPHNRHSFSVGAFVGIEPRFILVSNFERVDAMPERLAASSLFVSEARPKRPKAYVSGQTQHVDRVLRRRLEHLIGGDVRPETIYAALAEVNRGVAKASRFVSAGCVTNHISRTGHGGGLVHGIEVPATVLGVHLPQILQDEVTKLLDKQFGKGKARLRSYSSARSEPTEEFHRVQLQSSPLDPSVYSNYGAFLKDQKSDSVGAEKAYRRALELEPAHTNALGNLANLLAEQENFDEAEQLYRKALENRPLSENVVLNFARFLLRLGRDPQQARDLVESAIAAHPQSGLLHLLLGELDAQGGRAEHAVEALRRARELGAPQADVETYYALALHLGGAPVGDCIAAYRTAIALNPGDANLKLNIGQLLLLVGASAEGATRLREALDIGLDPSAGLEAHFYRLAYSIDDPHQVLEAMEQAFSAGGRLVWNVTPNVEQVRIRDQARAVVLEQIRQALASNSFSKEPFLRADAFLR